MNLFEGYKKAVEIYNKNSGTNDGRKFVTWYNRLGVSKEYLVWFTTCIVCYGIPLYIVLNTYRDWKRYVVSFYKNKGQPTPNIENLNYQQVIKITNECKRHWAKPNPLYDKDGIYVGALSTFQMANMLPINTSWCITKTPKRYEEFNNDKQKCLYIINSNNTDPFRRVIAVCGVNNVEYWDSANHRMEEEKVVTYENTLPLEVKNIIHNYACQMNNNQELNNESKNMNKKQIIRLTESKLHRIIKESVRRVLREAAYDINSPEYKKEFDNGSSNWWEDEEMDKLTKNK